MSASPSQSQSASTGGVETDRCGRAALLLLFISAGLWLVTASVFGILATLKFHKPDMLADCPWLTYGRVHPAHLNALVYGFAAQAGFGVVLWLLCQIGKTRLAFTPGIIVGTIVWNIGVKLGIYGILVGDSTGFEWLEMPGYASTMLFCGSLVIGLGAMLTLHQRSESRLSIAQWFMLAAVFWFPWIYSTANLLLVAWPVRGVTQAAVGFWYANNLTTIWFGFMGLATFFYFIPLLTKRPLHSHHMAVFAFWTLALFGSWGGIPAASPLPAWMPAMSTAGAVLTLIPVLAIALNLHRTAQGSYSTHRKNTPFKFILFGAAAWVVAGLLTAWTSLDKVSVVTQFTWLAPAQTQWLIYGFFAMTMFGAIYHIVPRLLPSGFSPRLVRAHFWLSAVGIVFYALPLALGGIKQGFAMNLQNTGFLDVVVSTLMFIKISTLGDLLMAAGNVVFVLNIIGLLVREGRARFSTLRATYTRPVEVAS